jgi:hypothetical protein
MAKAINWPAQYRDTVLNEPLNTTFAAVRLGRLYFDNQFWVPDEVVDVRVNSLVVRRGQVVGELWCGALANLPAEVYPQLKPDLQTPEALLEFLKRTYQQTITPTTEVTVVRYRNHPVDPDRLEHPPRG